jgi:hypothetical protein
LKTPKVGVHEVPMRGGGSGPLSVAAGILTAADGSVVVIVSALDMSMVPPLEAAVEPGLADRLRLTP